ncbi:hypothetical protein [Halobacillus faecis]|uniref:Uncharacterized protein n=1 Tax=Halobacillus faecis TaxID=360184 RepID=A0A511WN11_9BACI|nr:hypothetical protein [Halobacillus faecis]GEN52529.1 hypothetical protein HFA01_07910 [Halobacillus faecis]
MRNFLAVLVVWNFAFVLIQFPKPLRTTYEHASVPFTSGEWHTVYLAVFLLLMLVLFPLSFLMNRIVDRLEIGRFFIKLGLYVTVCSLIWMFVDPYFIFFYEMIAVVALFAVLYEWLGKLSRNVLHKIVIGVLAFSLLVAFILFGI